MILKESEIGDTDLIYPILGKPYKEPGKIFTATGSSMYFVKQSLDTKGNPLPLKRDEMKGIFQRYEKGLQLFLNKSNYQNAILINYDSIKSIVINKVEEISTVTDSFWLKALSLFDSIPFINEITNSMKYQRRETELIIITDFMKMTMITSYSSYQREVSYFKNLDCAEKVIIKKNGS